MSNVLAGTQRAALDFLLEGVHEEASEAAQRAERGGKPGREQRWQSFGVDARRLERVAAARRGTAAIR